MNPRKLSYLWLLAGGIFLIVGLFGLFTGSWMSLLTIAIAALIIYTSIYQLGGWAYVKHDLKSFFKSRPPAKKPRKNDHLKVVK